MRHHKLLVLLGGILLVVSMLFLFSFKAPTAHAYAINGCPPTLSQGNSGTWVQVLQFKLNNFHQAGTPLATDGSFGPKTEAAVVAFQKAAGLWPSGGGVVGSHTWSVLTFCTTDVKPFAPGFGNESSCPPTLGVNSNGIWVKALQDRLNFEYYSFIFSNRYPDSWTPYLNSDGSFGTETYHAVVDYQYAVGISADGTVGPHTWDNLYMCS